MRTEGPSLALAAVLVAFGPSLARAEARVEIGSVSLEDLLDLEVEAVTRRAERTSAAPAWVFVLTADDLRRLGARTLQDALRTVPGMFAYADGLYPMVGVRGVGLLSDYTTRLLVLVDGHPLNNSVGIGQSYLGADLPVPMSAVRRIEVIEGPVGSVYGPTAFLGVVNVVTRAPGAGDATVLALAEGTQGALRGARVEAAGGAFAGDVAASASAAGWWSRGPSWRYPELALDADRAIPADLRVRDADSARSASAYVRATWRGLALAAACGAARRGVPSSPYSALVGDDRTSLENRTCFGQLAWSGAPAPSLDVSARASIDAFQFADAFAYEPPPADVGLFRDRAWDRWISAELRADWSPGEGSRISAGVAGEAHRTSQRVFAEDPSVGAAIEKDFATLNAYALAETTLWRSLRLHGGVTFHAHELFGSRLTPKIAAVLRATPEDVVKAVYSRGFRAPTAAEAFYEDGTDFLANPALRPETVDSLEVVLERHLLDAAWVTVSAFRNVYRDLIRFETVPAPGLPGPPDPANPADWRQQGLNLDELRTFGGQLGFTARLREGVVAWGGLSAQGADGGRPVNFPALTASLSVSSRWPWRPLTLSLSAAAVSSRRRDETALAPGTDPEVPAAVVASAAGALDVPGVPGLRAEVVVRGIFGERMVHPVTGDFSPITGIPEPAPVVEVGVRWSP